MLDARSRQRPGARRVHRLVTAGHSLVSLQGRHDSSRPVSTASAASSTCASERIEVHHGPNARRCPDPIHAMLGLGAPRHAPRALADRSSRCWCRAGPPRRDRRRRCARSAARCRGHPPAAPCVLDAVSARRAQHAALPHDAAEALAHVRAHDASAVRPGQRGAHRGAESLGERDHHGVGARGEIGQRRTGRGRGIPEARAIEVHRQPCARDVMQRVMPASGVTTPPAPLCVFSTHTRRPRALEPTAKDAPADRRRIASTALSPCTVRTCTPASAAAPAISQSTMCESAST